MTIYRIHYRDRDRPRLDCDSFVQAVRAIRAAYPGVDFGEWCVSWQVDYRCPCMRFSIGGVVVGYLHELTLQQRDVS